MPQPWDSQFRHRVVCFFVKMVVDERVQRPIGRQFLRRSSTTLRISRKRKEFHFDNGVTPISDQVELPATTDRHQSNTRFIEALLKIWLDRGSPCGCRRFRRLTSWHSSVVWKLDSVISPQESDIGIDKSWRIELWKTNRDPRCIGGGVVDRRWMYCVQNDMKIWKL